MSRPRLVIVGAGEHGRVMADVLREQEEVDLLGFVDDDPELLGREVDGVRVLARASDPEWPGKHGATHFLAAIGNNAIRAARFAEMESRGLAAWSAIHPSAVIARSAEVGAGTQIVAGVVINPGAVIGRNVILNTSCSIDHDCRIGDHAFIAPGVHLGGTVTVGEAALMGIGAVALPGVTIGERAIVGGGAVVTKDLPPGVVAIGCPAGVRSSGE
ncbi:MAG: acetyltransferase [Armatimonadetes bacterium]|nr:acetyltransferase [Armatimonadota bacterium]